MNLDPQEQKYYEDYLSMFMTGGWVQFKKDMTDSLETDEQTADVRCTSNDLWQYERGTKSMLRKMIGFEESIRSSYESLTTPQEEDFEPEWD